MSTLAEQVAAALRGHSLDTMSQDSGKHCKCGSDSRFEQWDGDRPWKSMDEHRANAVVRVVAEWLGSEDVVELTARAMALIEPGDDWPTNLALGGNLTGTRDDEYRYGMREQATETLDALRREVRT